MNLLSRLSIACAAAAVVLAAPIAASACEQATVKEEANLRLAPTSSASVLAVLPAGASVEISCWVKGEPTYGTDRPGSTWLLTSTGGWVHAKLLTPVSVSECATGIVPAVPGVPFENCDEARASGPTPVLPSNPRFGPHLDRDSDGVGCEVGE